VFLTAVWIIDGSPLLKPRFGWCVVEPVLSAYLAVRLRRGRLVLDALRATVLIFFLLSDVAFGLDDRATRFPKKQFAPDRLGSRHLTAIAVGGDCDLGPAVLAERRMSQACHAFYLGNLSGFGKRQS